MSRPLTLVDAEGDLIATLMRVVTDPDAPNWLVYWGLRYTAREGKRFANRVEALAWVRTQVPQARVLK